MKWLISYVIVCAAFKWYNLETVNLYIAITFFSALKYDMFTFATFNQF